MNSVLQARDRPHQLLNMKRAAVELGVSVWVLKGIKVASAGKSGSPFTGRYTSVSRIETWLSENPEFVASHYLRPIRGRVQN